MGNCISKEIKTVWLINEGENLPGDDNNPRLQRMGLLAYELSKCSVKIVWWQSTFNHYQKKFRQRFDSDVKLADNLDLKLLHSYGYSKNVSLRRIAHETKTARKFYKQAKLLPKPDVLVVAMPTIALTHYAVKYAKKNNIPVLVDVRDLNPDVFISPFKGIMRSLVGIGIQPLKWILGRALRSADGLIGTTEPYLQWGLNYARRSQGANDRVFFVSYPDNGQVKELPETSRWKSLAKYDGITCCFFGQFGRLVDFDTILETATMCKMNNLQCRFLLCGKGELWEHYNTRVANEHLDNVILPGWVNQTDIQEIGAIADVGLMAYKQDDNFDMQMPNKFSEYLSLGLAIMLQPKGVMLKAINSHHCGVSYNTSDEMYNALHALSMDKEQLMKMKSNARLFFETSFSVEKVYGEYSKYILNI